MQRTNLYKDIVFKNLFIFKRAKIGAREIFFDTRYFSTAPRLLWCMHPAHHYHISAKSGRRLSVVNDGLGPLVHVWCTSGARLVHVCPQGGLGAAGISSAMPLAL